MNRYIFNFYIISLLFFVINICGCSNDSNHANSQIAAPVHIDIVKKSNVPRLLHAVGNVKASASVGVKTRVTGEILHIHFKEGQDVKEGDPLITIDPRPFEANLREKRGLLAKSMAQLNKANDDMRRYGKLVGGGYVSREAYEQAATEAASLKATVQSDQAAVESAILDLSYCTVASPISGRLGGLNIDKGNMVKSNDDIPIITVNTISPIYVTFSVPEVNLPIILEYLKQGKVEISAKPIGGIKEIGELTLIDNTVDTRTGTVRLRGTFENKQHNLWPGQFVEVELPLGLAKNALIIPSKAIQSGRDGSYIYSVDNESRAKYVKVKPIFEYNNTSVVEGDLKEGDKVVIDGQVRLAPGLLLNIIQ